MHQLEIVDGRASRFPRRRSRPSARSPSTRTRAPVVLTPFSGRVTRLIAKIGDDVKRGDPLFEIDSPEVVQAQTDLIAAVQALDKSKSQLALAKRTLDRQTGLYRRQRHVATRARAGQHRPRRGRDRPPDGRGGADGRPQPAARASAAATRRWPASRGAADQSADHHQRADRRHGHRAARSVPASTCAATLGEPLYSIADLSIMWLKANVPENDIPARPHRPGDRGQGRGPCRPRVQGAHHRHRAASDAATRRVVVRSEIANPDGALRGGNVRHLQDRHRQRRARRRPCRSTP